MRPRASGIADHPSGQRARLKNATAPAGIAGPRGVGVPVVAAGELGGAVSAPVADGAVDAVVSVDDGVGLADAGELSEEAVAVIVGDAVSAGDTDGLSAAAGPAGPLGAGCRHPEITRQAANDALSPTLFVRLIGPRLPPLATTYTH